MKIYHTSPGKIEKISSCGMFDDCLFFSSDVYTMSGAAKYVYSLEIDSDDIIDVSQFFYDADSDKLGAIVSEIQELVSCDEAEAESLLDDSAQSDDAEISWKIQALQGAAAKALGYGAAESTDEQGAVYIVPMHRRENDLTLDREI